MFMNTLSVPTVAAISLLGLIAGYVANDGRGVSPHPNVISDRGRVSSASSQRRTSKVEISYVSSSETLTSVIEKGEEATFSEITTWLLDASSP